MIVKYFRATDTALLEFSSEPAEETHAISDDILIDLDKDGNPVSMTIEHAGTIASLPSIQLQEIGAPS